MVIERPENSPDAWSERARTIDQSWQACGWSPLGQQRRFVEVLRALGRREGETILDWGCGTGDLSEYIPEGYYWGYDWAEGMVTRALADHPGHMFTDYEPICSFDLVACVGPFNLKDNWSKLRTWHTLRHLWDRMQCRSLAVSLYAGSDPNCLTYAYAEAIRAGRDLSYRVHAERIRDNDILLVVNR